MIDDFTVLFIKWSIMRPRPRRPKQPDTYPGHRPHYGAYGKARIGRYGPMVEIKGNEGEKSRFASLKKGQLIESLTLEEALALFSLPATWGPTKGRSGHRHRKVRALRAARQIVRIARPHGRSLYDRLRPRCGARARTADPRRCSEHSAQNLRRRARTTD